MTPTVYAIAGYLLLQFALGIWISRRIRTEEDYLVAGRRLGYPLATFSIFATWFGAETMIGAAGATYVEGVSFASPEPFGYGLCLILMGLVFAGALWRQRLTTLADLFRRRYSPGVERLAAIVLIPGSVLWAAAQIRAFGHVLSSVSQIDAALAISAAAAIVVLYTTFGGLMADAITDLVQGTVLVAGLALLGWWVTEAAGGIDVVIAAASATRESTASSASSVLQGLEAWAIPVLGSVIAIELVARILASRSATVASRSAMLAGGIYITVGLIPVMIGAVGPQLLPELAESEQLLPAVAQRVLPTAAYVVFAGALISAILSTVDSTLIASSGLLSHNLLTPLLGVRSERGRVLLARGGVVSFGIIAYVLALRSGGVLELVEQASAFGSAGIVVTVCFALFTRAGGALAAGGTLVTGILSYAGASLAGFSFPFLLSLAASLAAYIGLALLEQRAQPWPDRGRTRRAGAAAPRDD